MQEWLSFCFLLFLAVLYYIDEFQRDDVSKCSFCSFILITLITLGCLPHTAKKDKDDLSSAMWKPCAEALLHFMKSLQGG